MLYVILECLNFVLFFFFKVRSIKDTTCTVGAGVPPSHLPNGWGLGFAPWNLPLQPVGGVVPSTC